MRRIAGHRLTTPKACDTLVLLTGQISPPTIAPSYRDCTMSHGPHGGGPLLPADRPHLPPTAPTLTRLIAPGHFVVRPQLLTRL